MTFAVGGDAGTETSYARVENDLVRWLNTKTRVEGEAG